MTTPVRESWVTAPLSFHSLPYSDAGNCSTVRCKSMATTRRCVSGLNLHGGGQTGSCPFPEISNRYEPTSFTKQISENVPFLPKFPPLPVPITGRQRSSQRLSENHHGTAFPDIFKIEQNWIGLDVRVRG